MSEIRPYRLEPCQQTLNNHTDILRCAKCETAARMNIRIQRFSERVIATLPLASAGSQLITSGRHEVSNTVSYGDRFTFPKRPIASSAEAKPSITVSVEIL